MHFLKLFKIAITALQVNILRSALTMLGIVIGVGSVIVMVSMGAGAQAQIDDYIESLGGNILMVSNVRQARVAGGNSSARITSGDADVIGSQAYGVEVAAPIQFGSSQIIYGDLNWSPYQMIGVDNRYFDARDWPTTYGRLFSAQEVSSSARVALIGETIRVELFGASDPVGQTIRINNFNAEVIGVLAKKGQDAAGNDQDDVVMLPIQTMRTKISGVRGSTPDAVSMIYVKAQDSVPADYVQEEIANILRDTMRVSAGATDPFSIRNLSETIETRAETQKVFNQLLAAVASVSLIVGGIGIMNIMLVSVTERTREIGLRMAVGATPKDILLQFLVEAIVLCALGGALGVAIAYIIVELAKEFAGFVGLIKLDVVVLSVLFSAAFGVFFGFYPAHKASQLQPIDALRYE